VFKPLFDGRALKLCQALTKMLKSACIFERLV